LTQKLRSFGTALLLCTGGLVAVAAKPSQDTSVTSTIVDGSAYQIGSDSLGPYKNASNLTSLILANGDYSLGGFYQSGATRTVALALTGAGISGTGPNGSAPVAPPDGLYNVSINSECANVGLSYFVPQGTTIQCPMNVHFAYGGATYDLHQASANVNFPESTSVDVTCTAGAGSACSAWTVQPSPASGQGVANLSIEKTIKGRLTYVKQGDFLVSFLIHITKP
jgi:hypothetical protein